MNSSKGNDRAITDFSMMLRAVDHIPEFREHYMKLNELLYDFLAANNLFREEFKAVTRDDFKTCVLRFSNLKPHAALLFEPPINAYSKWLSANDRIDKAISMRVLENGLKKAKAETRADED